MKMKHAENKWNLERQRRQFLEEENKKLRAEIAVAENVQRRLFCQDGESGKCKNYFLCFICMWSLESTLPQLSILTLLKARRSPPTKLRISFACDIKNENLDDDS